MHAWERQLADVTKDRVVRPFEWGLEWIPENHHRNAQPPEIIGDWISSVMADTDAFFSAPPLPADDYRLGPPSAEGDSELTFPSAFVTPHPENNLVRCRLFQAKPVSPKLRSGEGGLVANKKAAVLVLPQWNSDPGGHVGLCKLLTMAGMNALRLSMPYHDKRMPPELHRADYIVSSNVARTVQVCRQAVLDARRAIAWLHQQGYERIGILGTSLGSCLSLLTTAHEPLIQAAALNHVSPHFADVVWRGISTRHVREGLDGNIELDLLRMLWKPISPHWFLERLRGRKILLVYAKYDLTFPPDLSRDLVAQFEQMGIPHEVATLSCGHYSSGKTPFKFLDGWILTRFLRKNLVL
jgi:hypothetical protein